VPWQFCRFVLCALNWKRLKSSALGYKFWKIVMYFSNVMSCVWVYAWWKERVLIRMTGFISTSVTISFNYNKYSAITDLYNLQFTVAHALGFLVSTSRLLITDLNTETRTSDHCEVFLPFLVQSPWNLPRSGLHNPVVPLLVLVLLRIGSFCGSTVLTWSKYATVIYESWTFCMFLKIIVHFWGIEN
jgi:hypothetical protein